MRALQQASGLRKVQRKLGVQRFSLGSLSEATEVFDPEKLREIVVEMGKDLQPVARDPRLKDVRHAVTLVDGSLAGQQCLPGDRRATPLPDRYRWTIEIFFRFLKHVLGCRHLYSHDTAGIQIQAYRAIIACMLISLWTGRKPTQRTYEMICYYFLGLAEEDELLAHSAKLQRHEESQKT
jgi:hypothetical protein